MTAKTTKKKTPPRKIRDVGYIEQETLAAVEELSETIPLYTQKECEAVARRQVELKMREFCNELECAHVFVRVPVAGLFQITHHVPRRTLEKISNYLMNREGLFPTNPN